MTLRNQHAKPKDSFFFGDHLILTEKTVRFSVKIFFFCFGDHLVWTEKTVRISVKTCFFFGVHIIRTKLRHYLHLFWSSQNRKSVIFELAPGLRSALGAPDKTTVMEKLLYIDLTQYSVLLTLLYGCVTEETCKPAESLSVLC